jgi:hypothetical protein
VCRAVSGEISQQVRPVYPKVGNPNQQQTSAAEVNVMKLMMEQQAQIAEMKAELAQKAAKPGSEAEGRDGVAMVQNQTASIDFNTAATQTVVPAVAGKRIVVYGYALFNGVATAQSVQFKSGSTLLAGVQQLPLSVGGGAVVFSGDQTISLFTTNPGDALSLTMTAATQVGGHISYKYV